MDSAMAKRVLGEANRELRVVFAAAAAEKVLRRLEIALRAVPILVGRPELSEALVQPLVDAVDALSDAQATRVIDAVNRGLLDAGAAQLIDLRPAPTAKGGKRNGKRRAVLLGGGGRSSFKGQDVPGPGD